MPGGIMKLFVATSIALCALYGKYSSAHAGDMLPVSPRLESNSTEPDQWHFSASPYFWAAGIDGKVGQFGLTPTRLKSDFSSILNDLDFSFMGVAEARYDRYSLFSDVMYTKISKGGNSPVGFLSKSVDVTSQTFSGFFGGGYSVFEDDKGRLDLVAGARVWYASTEISISGGLLDGKSKSDNAFWVDAVAGIRGQYFLTDNLYLTGWALVGGGQAKLDWDVTAAFGYRIQQNLSAVAGYRALGVDYSHDGFVYDVVQQGPILGLVYHF